MKFLKNRTVLGVVCIVLSLIICFAITPLFNASKSSTMKIVRVKSNLKGKRSPQKISRLSRLARIICRPR